MSEPLPIDIILMLTPKTREILELMHFDHIPAEAKHLAFFEDGNVHYFDNFRPRGLIRPKINQLVYYTDTALFEK